MKHEDTLDSARCRGAGGRDRSARRGSIGSAGQQPFFAFDNGTGRGELPPEAQAKLLKELGYDGIGYTGTEDIPAMLKALDDQGLAMFSTYVEGKVGPDGPKLDPGLKTAIEQLKGRDTILWLYITGKADDDAQAVTLVQQAADMAKPAGLRVVLYPHVGFYVATIEDALRVREKAARDNVGVALNLCHFLKADKAENLEKAVKAAGPHLWLVSINGADRDGTDWNALIQTLDRGTFDVAAFLRDARSGRLPRAGRIAVLQRPRRPPRQPEALDRGMAADEIIRRRRASSPAGQEHDLDSGRRATGPGVPLRGRAVQAVRDAALHARRAPSPPRRAARPPAPPRLDVSPSASTS